MSEYINDTVNQPPGLDWAVSFNRKASAPLDKTELFESYSDAVAYAKGDGSDLRGLGTTSYVGQKISVNNAGYIQVYYIDEYRQLRRLVDYDYLNNQLQTIPKLDIQVVDELPEENISFETIYLVRGKDSSAPNAFSEYIYVKAPIQFSLEVNQSVTFPSFENEVKSISWSPAHCSIELTIYSTGNKSYNDPEFNYFLHSDMEDINYYRDKGISLKVLEVESGFNTVDFKIDFGDKNPGRWELLGAQGSTMIVDDGSLD